MRPKPLGPGVPARRKRMGTNPRNELKNRKNGARSGYFKTIRRIPKTFFQNQVRSHQTPVISKQFELMVDFLAKSHQKYNGFETLLCTED